MWGQDIALFARLSSVIASTKLYCLMIEAPRCEKLETVTALWFHNNTYYTNVKLNKLFRVYKTLWFLVFSLFLFSFHTFSFIVAQSFYTVKHWSRESNSHCCACMLPPFQGIWWLCTSCYIYLDSDKFCRLFLDIPFIKNTLKTLLKTFLFTQMTRAVH